LLSSRTSSDHSLRIAVLFTLCAFLFASPIAGQVRKSATVKRGSSARINTSTAAQETERRLQKVQAARNSGDPERIADANRQLIALALRQMAHLRLLEAAFPASIDLYRRSLDFEDNPETRIDLAVAYLRTKKADESLTEAAKAVLAEPNDPRGWHIQGKAWMMKRDYEKAAESLSRSIALHGDPEAAYSLAISWLGVHQKEKAAAVFQQMLASAPRNREVLHVLFARAYRDAEYLDDAIRELKLALAISPLTPRAHYFLGLVWLIKEEWVPNPEIRKQFLEELKYRPRDFLSNYLLGAIDSTTKNYEESNRHLKIATAIDPAWPEPWLYLGLNAVGEGHTAEAEAYLRKAIDLTGTNYARSNYIIRRGYFALGRLLSSAGRKDEAQPFLQKARELQERVQADGREKPSNPSPSMGSGDLALPSEQSAADDSPELMQERGDSTARLDASLLAQANLTEQEKKQALAEEEKLRTILGASFNDLATSEAVRQKYDLAFVHYQEAEHWNPALPGLSRNLGVAAVRAQKYADAIPPLSQALSLTPADNALRAMLGMSYYMTDHYKETATTISPLGETVFQDPGLSYALADAYIKQGQLKEGGQVLLKLEKESLPPDTLMLVAHSWDEAGNPLHAAEIYHRVAEQNPTQPRVHYSAGLAYINADRTDDAAAEFKAELAHNPKDADAKYNLGFVYLQQAKSQEAEALFREVLAAQPEHAKANYQLGKILMDRGKAEDAIPYLESATRLSPQTDYMHYQLQFAYRKQSRLQDADRELAIYKELKAQNRQRNTPQADSNP
jgi:tetratricopeptide (TPR) repeat protein